MPSVFMKGEQRMSDKKIKMVLSGVTVVVSVLKIIVQHSNQIKRAGGKS